MFIIDLKIWRPGRCNVIEITFAKATEMFSETPSPVRPGGAYEIRFAEFSKPPPPPRAYWT